MNTTSARAARASLPSSVLAAAGHYWTVAPVARHALRPLGLPRAAPWSTWAPDPKLDRVRISGVLHERPIGGSGSALVVILHGLGGDIDSHYVRAAASAADAAGFASLRLNLRGADRTGEALYHAALTDDIHAALASAELAAYDRLYLLGYSLGGHLVLRASTESLDPRVRAVAAVCPPLDLHVGSRAIDEPHRVLYRQFVLNALQELYAAVARRRATPLSAWEARRIRKMREWDERIVAPWFGFPSAAAYYDEVSVAPKLGEVALPALVVAARHDPMVPEFTVRPSLEKAGARIDVRWIERGGHVGFPASAELGLRAQPGLEPQIMAWLKQHP